MALNLRFHVVFSKSRLNMHLVVAIPTYNRCNYLRKNIQFFDQQKLPENAQISLAISNSASTDETEAFLRDFSSSRQDVSVFNRLTDWSGGNYGYLCEALPEDADWVWFMGDDDYLADPLALQKICEILIEKNDDQEFKFVHACQARRSLETGRIIHDSIMGLCNQFGYTEMFGWISSVIMRKQPFVNALKKVNQRAQAARDECAWANSHSAFFQASYLLEEIIDSNGAFIDLPLVEPQDQEMTEATRQRWQAENMGERYIYIIDDLNRLKSLGLPIQKLDPKFFRYHRYQLWDRFINHQINLLEDFGNGVRTGLVMSSMERFLDNWKRIQSIPSFIKNPLDRKLLYSLIETNIGLCTLYMESGYDQSVKDVLSRQKELNSVAVYDFSILEAD